MQLPRHFPAVKRARGVTPAERYLQDLCDRSFLSLWSYPNTFRDQKTGGKGSGKELCDLLVVFGDDVLIFSDKSCAYPNTGNPQVDWTRWFRTAVLKSAEQAWGAERWLKAYPERVFIDRACTERIPFSLPSAERMRCHRIVVAHNVSERCAAALGGVSGSLLFDSGAVGKNASDPFTVGWIDQNRGFVHVLDDESLEILLETRDTITDFVDYLRWKEEFLAFARQRSVRVMHTGEEELLAKYLLTFNGGKHGFSLPGGCDILLLEEGDWEHFQASSERAAQIEADKVSYLSDEVVEKFNKHTLEGTSHPKSTPLIAHREKIMRFFAREPRTRRRMLAETLLTLLEKAKFTDRTTRIVLPSNSGDPYYCLLALSNMFGKPAEEYRAVRGNLLEALCRVTKLKFPDALDIVGFATEAGVHSTTRSEDSMYLDARNWSDEDEVDAQRLHRDLGLLTNLTTSRKTYREFPSSEGDSESRPGPNPRNKPCPCGSGKNKRCYGA